MTPSPRCLLLAFAVAFACATPRHNGLPSNLPASPTQVSGFIREHRLLEVVLADGSPAKLEVLITRPEQAGRVPLVIINHGTPRESAEKSKRSPAAFAEQSMAFARRGYGAVALMRHGFGESDGPYRESTGGCANQDYAGSTRASADDLLAALRALQQEPWVDPARVILLGPSTGGIAALAAGATNPPGVLGVISFAGGRGSDRPDHVCQPERLVTELQALGKTARLPTLWIYAENDHFFSPALGTDLVQAYANAGGNAQLIRAPPFGEDGHLLFPNAPVELWWKHISPFLGKLGLPTEVIAAKPLVALPAPASLDAGGRAAFAEYLASDGLEKAFAVGGTAWGWSHSRETNEEAVKVALDHCHQTGKRCTLYAVGDQLAH